MGYAFACNHENVEHLGGNTMQNQNVTTDRIEARLADLLASGTVSDFRMALANLTDIDFDLGIGMTLLHRCSEAGRLDFIEELIGRGANANKANEVGVTPLQMAIYGGNEECVRYLIAHGARTDAEAELGVSLSDYARGLKKYRIAEIVDSSNRAHRILPQ